MAGPDLPQPRAGADASTEVAHLRDELHRAHYRETGLELTNARLSAERDALEDEKREQAARLDQLANEVAAAHADRDTARAEIAAMRGSVSWRITRPLRRIRALIRRVANLAR